jgi:hypothetical protein
MTRERRPSIRHQDNGPRRGQLPWSEDVQELRHDVPGDDLPQTIALYISASTFTCH